MNDAEPPDRYRFKDYKQEAVTLVKKIDTTFSVDPGRIGEIKDSPSKYFSTLSKLKEYINAKVYTANLSIIHRFQLKNLRECLNLRLSALNCKILPLGFGQ